MSKRKTLVQISSLNPHLSYIPIYVKPKEVHSSLTFQNSELDSLIYVVSEFTQGQAWHLSVCSTLTSYRLQCALLPILKINRGIWLLSYCMILHWLCSLLPLHWDRLATLREAYHSSYINIFLCVYMPLYLGLRAFKSAKPASLGQTLHFYFTGIGLSFSSNFYIGIGSTIVCVLFLPLHCMGQACHLSVHVLSLPLHFDWLCTRNVNVIFASIQGRWPTICQWDCFYTGTG